ncbi:MAG: chemotaxis protein CheA [Gammaproteobacteria bacterium]|nr:chemotaxis protein CheA [Gammaproteobacteria bacterium]
MGIDVSQFVQAFLEESFEGLDLMESELLDDEILDSSCNGERINTIFRAAHSIKGSAGTFGFGFVGEFTHGVETLLDRIRSGQRPLTEDARALLLEAVDRIRDMLIAARDKSPLDNEAIERTRKAIDAMLESEPGDAPAAAARESREKSAAPAESRWRIRFSPHRSLFATGNDPLRILGFLRDLGTLAIECDDSALPKLAELEPESCYLRWTLELEGPATEAQVREAFEWVEDQCDLEITRIDAPAADTSRDSEAAADASSLEGAADEPASTDAARAGRADQDRRRAADRRNDAGSIRVAVEKIDQLVNLVGELVISQAMLETIARTDFEDFDAVHLERLRQGLAQLERNTRELQEAVLGVRMIPINFVFSRLPRLVRDLASTLGKEVNLVLEGEDTELDKGVIEKLADPLTHMVRNAIDHGIEKPDARVRAGKPRAGTLKIRAAHQGGNIVIEVSDDGAGLNRERILAKAAERGLNVPENPSDREVWQLICTPGFSTAEKITDISGRGVGMDVVRQNIEAIKGRLEIDSTPGHGTRMTIRLPLTLAILDGMSVRVGDEIFIVPLTAILESLQPKADQVYTISGRGRVLNLRGDYVPLVSLSDVFHLPSSREQIEDGICVVVESAEDRAALFVDELIAQHQVVIKSLETNYRRVPGISGATILGDGRVALILDVDMLTQMH